jgi:hypothetical protein
MQNKFSKTKGVKKKILKTNYKRIKKKNRKNGIDGPSVKNKKIFFFKKI